MNTYTHHFAIAPGVKERFLAALLRTLIFLFLRPFLGWPWPAGVQRGIVWLLSLTSPSSGGVRLSQIHVGHIPVEVIEPEQLSTAAVVLYLHGGAFLFGSPRSHRALTTRLALETGARVWVPDYRLAPENPYPAGLHDCIACYKALLAQGVKPGQIVVAGDSAGGALTLALSLSLKRLGIEQPAGLMALSPVVDPTLSADSHQRYRHTDPMLRPSLFRQCLKAYQLPDDDMTHRPLQQPLDGLPPLLIQVGTIELLHDDSVHLAEHAQNCGVAVQLEIYTGLWHVFQLNCPHLATARTAVARLAQHVTRVTNPSAQDYATTRS